MEEIDDIETKDKVLRSISNFDSLTLGTQVMIRGVVNRLSQLGRLDVCDIPALTILANEFNRIEIINAKLLGVSLTSGSRKNPLLALLSTSEQVVLSILKEFGLTARARKNLTERDARTVQSNDLLDLMVAGER